VKHYDEGVLLQLKPSREDNLLVGVYHPAVGNVLSIGSTGQQDTLICMQQGAGRLY